MDGETSYLVAIIVLMAGFVAVAWLIDTAWARGRTWGRVIEGAVCLAIIAAVIVTPRLL